MPYRRRAIVLFASILIAANAAAEAPVQVETVSNRTVVKQINVAGTVTSPRTAVLSTAVAGIVAELTIDEGDRAETGAVEDQREGFIHGRFSRSGERCSLSWQVATPGWRLRPDGGYARMVATPGCPSKPARLS